MFLRLLCSFTFVVLHSLPAHSAIYSDFDIRELHDAPRPIRSLGMSIAAAIGNVFLVKNADGSWAIDDDSKTDTLCPAEPIFNQPSLTLCTGFLIGDRYLVTAGHCMIATGVVDDDPNHPFCMSFRWYFDFNVKPDGEVKTSHIPANRIYGCKRVIHAENDDGNYVKGKLPGADFALIELDRPVAKEIRPFRIAKTTVNTGDSVYTIGHPWGTPAKFSGTSLILKNDRTLEYFEANLDTLGGNSGGPVFNIHNETVGILVSGHPVDSYKTTQGCYRLNRCDESGRSCAANSKFEFLPVSNFIQRIETVLRYLPTSMATR